MHSAINLLCYTLGLLYAQRDIVAMVYPVILVTIFSCIFVVQ